MTQVRTSGRNTAIKITSKRAMKVLRANTKSTPNTDWSHDPSAGLITRLAAKVAETCPNAKLRSLSVVTSETYAKTIENVTAKRPDTATAATCHQRLDIRRNGSGRQVAATASNKNIFLPALSDNAPIKGALRNDRKPFKPCVNPSTSHLLSVPK